MKKPHETRVYSEAFKLQVVSEIESGKFDNAWQARCAYEIKGGNTVRNWVAKYGSEQIQPKYIKIMNKPERDEVKELKNRVKQLEKALCDSHLKGLLGESYLEIACEEIGVELDEFKKKQLIDLSINQSIRKMK